MKKNIYCKIGIYMAKIVEIREKNEKGSVNLS